MKEFNQKLGKKETKTKNTFGILICFPVLQGKEMPWIWQATDIVFVIQNHRAEVLSCRKYIRSIPNSPESTEKCICVTCASGRARGTAGGVQLNGLCTALR